MLKKQLESFLDQNRLKLTDIGAHCEPTINAAELVQQDLSSARVSLTAVESHRADLDRLRQMSVVLADTASEACQNALRNELDVLTSAHSELMEMLRLHITLLEKLHRRWTELTVQCSELKTLLVQKKELLQLIVLDTGLPPDQQYASVKVRIFFSGNW